MSSGWPVLWLSTNAVQFVLRLRRALFRSSFAFLFYARQTFPFLFRSSVPFFRLFRSYFVPLLRSSFRSSLFRRWGFPKHRYFSSVFSVATHRGCTLVATCALRTQMPGKRHLGEIALKKEHMS